MCDIPMSFQYPDDPENIPYEHNTNYTQIATTTCPFCKTRSSIVTVENDEVSLRDIEWDKIEADHWDKYNPLEEDISKLEDYIEGYDEDGEEVKRSGKEIIAAKKQIKTLQQKLDKLEESFDKKENAYGDRQDNWQEKVKKKFGDP